MTTAIVPAGQDLAGRKIVVTGATTGIGKETARGLARRGAEIVLVGRDPARTEAARAELAADCPSAILRTALADLSSLAEVRRLGAELSERYPALDVLVNNAGAVFGERALTVDGFERTFALNHLAYYALTDALLPSLRRAGAARIVNVSSEAHRIGRIHWDDLSLAEGYTQFKAYAQSKLANILYTRALARRLQGSGVTANCLHPGTIASGFGNSGSRFLRALVRLGRPFLMSAEKGARTSIHLAAAPEVVAVSGEYFVRRKVKKAAAAARDDEAAERLWALTADLVAGR